MYKQPLTQIYTLIQDNGQILDDKEEYTSKTKTNKTSPYELVIAETIQNQNTK